MALMLALAEGRERILFPVDGYYNTRALAGKLRPHGAEAVPVDQLDLAAVARALREAPSVLWAETPTNPLLRVSDLAALGEIADAAAPRSSWTTRWRPGCCSGRSSSARWR